MGNWRSFNGANMEGEGARCLKRGFRQILGGGGGGSYSLIRGEKELSFREEKKSQRNFAQLGSLSKFTCFRVFPENFTHHLLSLC